MLWLYYNHVVIYLLFIIIDYCCDFMVISASYSCYAMILCMYAHIYVYIILCLLMY